MRRKVIEEGLRWLDDAIGDDEEDAAAVRLQLVLQQLLQAPEAEAFLGTSQPEEDDEQPKSGC
jgi:hypothetical protein